MQLLSALLVSNDANAVRIGHRVLDGYNFSVKAVTIASQAREMIRTAKFDLAVYDQNLPGAIELASDAARKDPRVVFAILHDRQRTDISGKRIHLFLQGPLTPDLFARGVRAAYGMVAGNKRAVFRHPVHINPAAATLLHAGERRILKNVTILQLSQLGLGLSSSGILPQGAIVHFDFLLPGTQDLVHVSGVVAWSQLSGRSGIRFLRIPPEDHDRLQRWADTQPLVDRESESDARRRRRQSPGGAHSFSPLSFPPAQAHADGGEQKGSEGRSAISA